MKRIDVDFLYRFSKCEPDTHFVVALLVVHGFLAYAAHFSLRGIGQLSPYPTSQVGIDVAHALLGQCSKDAS